MEAVLRLKVPNALVVPWKQMMGGCMVFLGLCILCFSVRYCAGNVEEYSEADLAKHRATAIAGGADLGNIGKGAAEIEMAEDGNVPKLLPAADPVTVSEPVSAPDAVTVPKLLPTIDSVAMSEPVSIPAVDLAEMPEFTTAVDFTEVTELLPAADLVVLPKLEPTVDMPDSAKLPKLENVGPAVTEKPIEPGWNETEIVKNPVKPGMTDFVAKDDPVKPGEIGSVVEENPLNPGIADIVPGEKPADPIIVGPVPEEKPVDPGITDIVPEEKPVDPGITDIVPEEKPADPIIVGPVTEENPGNADTVITEDPAVSEKENPAEEVLEPLEIDGFLIDEEGYITGCTERVSIIDDLLLIPTSDRCVGIRAGALDSIGAWITEVYIPENICDIESGAFDGFSSLMYVEAAGGNPCCYSINGVLYSMSGEVLAMPMGW